MSHIKRHLFVLIVLIAFAAQALAASGFTVNKVEAQGLHRVSLGTFLSYMPLKSGDWFSYSDSTKIINTLYKTGFFSDVSLYRKNNNLLVKVVERPTIGALNISGNKKIKTKDLKAALKDQGIAVGEVFDHSVLEEVRQALLQQYYNLGHYNVEVSTNETKEPRNRVAVNITISEGPIAKIKEIKVIGNHKFSDKELLKDFSLSSPSLLTWITNADQYSKEKLDGDLEKLRSYYMDRGYLEFKIDSTQVSITPDKQHVYIVVHVVEGPIYHVSGVKLTGNLLDKRKEIEKLVQVHKGEVFSRKKVIDTSSTINKYLGNFGYAFANISPHPKIDKQHHLVFVDFKVKPGKRIYLRRINFSGNTKTEDKVLRRELRQDEGGLFDLSSINESKRRLSNLGYLKDVHPQLKPVPGQPNQVDLQYDVKEMSSASASVQLGYSDLDGLIYGASVSDRNFLGTGKTLGVQFDNSDYDDMYSIHYLNPYYTKNNISLDTSIFYEQTKPYDIDDVSDYAMDTSGIDVNYGIPVSELNRINIGYGYEHTEIRTYSGSPDEVNDFVNKYGRIFDNVKLNAGWQYSNLDRAIFPRKGFTQSIDGELGLPIMKRSLEYYKLDYDATFYQPMSKYFVLDLHGYLGYGNGYGKMHELPFFENYFAGGIGSVRGYDADSLGPLDSNGDSIGGNVSVYGSVGLVIPSPTDSIRPTIFVDAGNVYDKSLGYPVDASQLRYAVGLQIEWYTPFAPLVFS
ncbi:MAG: outer membrane protein assembly factor BamA, partial [Gammaproteobacteria bacterium]|nr:outer membrane protein assembly factor BamA [Gammaproteobacteria bacterium]